jgi:hypothetical protein
MYVIQHCFICRPSNSTVSEDAGIEPRTVATLALTDAHPHNCGLVFVIALYKKMSSAASRILLCRRMLGIDPTAFETFASLPSRPHPYKARFFATVG